MGQAPYKLVQRGCLWPKQESSEINEFWLPSTLRLELDGELWVLKNNKENSEAVHESRKITKSSSKSTDNRQAPLSQGHDQLFEGQEYKGHMIASLKSWLPQGSAWWKLI